MSIQILGMDDVKDVMSRLLPRHAKNLARATIHNVARQITKDAKQEAPKGTTGRVKRGHKAERRNTRGADTVASEVHINSAFYWRFQEYGTQDQPEHPFVRPAVARATADIDATFRKAFGEQLEKALAREAKKRAKKAAT